MAKKIPTMGPVRTNLEAFGTAILAAVLTKWFCLEAYQIPTSSMQPTLMGSTEAGVFDRILVDKILPTFREPQRWDVTVFRYPLQKNQNYVKRIGGMPGDHLLIGGGNIYQVREADGARSYEVLRKPEGLQADLWKNVYPLRADVRGDAKVLGEAWGASPARAFREDGQAIHAKLEGSVCRLYYRDEADGGFVDRVWDGYPVAVAAALREKTPHERPQEIVADARLSADVTVSATSTSVSLEIEVVRPGVNKLSYALEVANGKGRLVVRGDSATALAESAEFPCDMPAGVSVPLSFAHVDEQLLAWRDGVELMRLETAAWSCRDGCVLSNQGDKATAQQCVVPQIEFKGTGTAVIANLVLDRDQHYTRDLADEVIVVPEGHYYMLGDNTLQSIDSRGWTAISIGVLDGKVVPPDTPGARIVRGNNRPMDLTKAPDRDETPIALPNQNAIVMIDEYGEILRLEGQPGLNWGQGQVSFKNPDGQGEWQPQMVRNAKGVSFVRREDIQGRALLVFYPCRPLAWLTGNNWPGRFGCIR